LPTSIEGEPRAWKTVYWTGSIRRGEATTLSAALWYCDLRGFTRLSDRLEPDQMVAASSSLMLAYGLGAILGPVTVGQAMQHLGPPGYFVYLAAAHLLIGLFALWRMIRRPT